MITLDTVADFTWSYGEEFFLETPDGCYVWSDPDYGGDNTIRKFEGTYADWCKKRHLDFGRGKGCHKIGEYYGKDVIIEE